MSATDVFRHAGAFVGGVSHPRRGRARSEGFYIPPASLPEYAPGEIVRAEPMDAYLIPGVRLRAHATRVMYRSTAATGEPTAVTGTVLLPPGSSRRVRPLIGFAIGTHGIGDAAAPSRLLARGRDWEAGLIAMVLARGWAVAVTDYQGLGTPGDHAYMVGRALGANVLDAMRAARALQADVLPVEGPAAVIGYSEGGTAAAWAAQLQPEYAPELSLAGVAAGAAAADLESAVPKLDRSFFSFFVAYGGIGYAAAYPELELDRYLTPRAREGIDALRSSTVIEAAIRGPHFSGPDDLTSPNVFDMPEWRARLRENRLGTMKPEAPMLLHHARRDQIVSFEQSLELRDDWAELGVDVRLYVTRGGVDHLSGALAGTPVALEWLERRLTSGRRTAVSVPAKSLRTAA
jgi:pimeloyl-ACP methyl ester carboxylesterase